MKNIEMDILTHTLAGAAAGTVIAGFSKGGLKQKSAIIAVGMLGGFLPDIDAVSLWAKFDKTFGVLFGLADSGKDIYSAKFWYSHHAFMHSLLAGIIFTVLAGVAMFFVKNKNNRISFQKLKQSFIENRLALISFLSGYFLHLLADLPTPASTWGGIRMFFPVKAYVGGAGKIWWWNNYDIFLIVCLIIAVNIPLIFFSKYFKNKVQYFVIAIFAAGLFLSVNQIMSRGFDFGYSGHGVKYQEYEKKSKEIQKNILGSKIYTIMDELDKKLPVYF